MADLIEINDLGITYQVKDGICHAIQGVDFNAREGEFITIVGPSGCGKTTILKAVAGLLKPSTGSVRIGGKLVEGVNPSIGIVFQQPTLMAWRTIIQNIMLQVEVRHLNKDSHLKRAMELIRLTGLTGFENKWPYQLSGGMQQRASLCRALIHDPPLLLMDEPFGALDALTREMMNLELQRIWLERKKTVLFITHSVQEAVFLGDKVVVLSPRPAVILETVPLNFPRPRKLETMVKPEFTTIVGHIRGLLTAQTGME